MPQSSANLSSADLDHPRRKLWFGFGCFVILAAAGIVRFYASLGDFWLDEIWSWSLSLRVQSALDILTELQHDNNHFLYTWFLYLLGPEQHWTAYRIPSVLAGVGTVAAAGFIGRKHGRLEAVSAMLLTAGSYPLVHYSSEARGYGCVMFFALLSYLLLDRSLGRKRRLNDFAFAAAAILGFLSHLQFVFCYAGLFAWSVWRMLRERKWFAPLFWTNFRCHLPVLAFVGWLYEVNISQMATGGADRLPLSEVLVELLSLTAGGPFTGNVAQAAAAAACLAGVAGFLLLLYDASRKRSPAFRKKPGFGGANWMFYLTAVGLAPVMITWYVEQKYIYPRHFLVCAVFLLLLINHALVRLAQWKPAGKVLFAVLLAAFLAGNGLHIERLIRLGRGQYVAALQMINEQTSGEKLTIGSDHPFRNGMLLEFYQLQLPDLKPIVHYNLVRHPSSGELNWPPAGPQWFIAHHPDRQAHLPPEFIGPFDNRYRRVKTYPYAGLSGWTWGVYRRDEGALTGEE